MMCTETTWQFAAINLGAWHGPFFFPEEDGSDSTQDKTLFLPAYTVSLILALEKKKIILCSTSWARQDFMTSDQKIIERALNNVLKSSVCNGKVYLKQAVRQVTFGQVASVLSQAQSNFSPPLLRHVLSLGDLLIRNFLRNAHPLEKREKLG